MTDVRLTATTTDGEVVPVLSNTKGELLLEAPIAPPEFDGNLDGDLTVSGDASFAKKVTTKELDTTGNITADGNVFIGSGDGYIQIYKAGQLSLRYDGDPNNGGIQILAGGDDSSNLETWLRSDGAVSFSGGKAGFTENGYLWCTTRRGDTVILDATSNGLGTWADYTPTTLEAMKGLEEERDGSDNSQ